MKLYINIFLILLIGLVTAQETSFKSAELQTGRRTGCYGSGACTFTSSGTEATVKNIYAVAFDQKKQALLIRVNPKLISKQDEIAIFGAPITTNKNTVYSFVMQEELVLDNKTSKAIGGNQQNIKIGVGSYSIEHSGAYYYILIPIP